MVDYAMMSRNVRAFMSLFHCSKPVVCKVHGFCVAGGTDMALCSDLLVIAADAKIGYPPARVWGSPTTSMWAYRVGPQRAKRLLFTGDSLSGAEALEWGLAIEAPASEELDARTEALVGADRADAGQPAADDEAARQPVAVLAGPARDADCSGPCSTASPGTPPRATRSRARCRRGVSGGGARARRAVRRLRPVDVQGMTDQIVAPTRQRLLRSAQELIEEGGYGAATVIAIAERAGVAAGTLYRHFASKEELFVEVFRSVCDREVRAMRAAADAMPEDSSQVDRLDDRAGDVRRAGAAPAAARLGADRRAGRSAGRRRAARLPGALQRADCFGAAGGDRGRASCPLRTSS